MDKPHLSKTQLEMLARCGMQYEFRYIRGIKKPPGVALVIGLGTHASVEQDMREKMALGELLSDDQVKAAAGDATHRLWREMDPVRHDDDPDEGEAVDSAVGLALMHHSQLAPKIEPVAVERRFRIDLPGFPLDIVGVVDIEEKARTRDTKTSSKAPPADEAANSIQGDIYTLESKLRGEDKPFALDYLIKGSRPRVITLESTRTESQHNALLQRVELASRQLEAGVFPPTGPGNWWCSQKWCGYWNECPHGARQSVSVGLIDPKRLTSRTEVWLRNDGSPIPPTGAPDAP